MAACMQSDRSISTNIVCLVVRGCVTVIVHNGRMNMTH